MNAKPMSRRQFLQWAATVTAGIALSNCTSPPTAAPTATPAPTPTTVTKSNQRLIAGLTPWAPWQIEGQGNEPPTGIVVDVMAALSRISGIDILIDMTPQKRMLENFAARSIDAEAASNPAWRVDYEAISVYTAPYCSTIDVMLMPAGSGFQPTGLQDFHGMRMGCVLGYYYPLGLQEEMESGAILRDDAPANENNLQKLVAGRVDVIIIEKVVGLYLIKQLGIAPDALEIVYEHSHADLSMRLHKDRADLLPTLNTAIETLIAENTVHTIINQYIQ